jgi:hypothetical protein
MRIIALKTNINNNFKLATMINIGTKRRIGGISNERPIITNLWCMDIKRSFIIINCMNIGSACSIRQS